MQKHSSHGWDECFFLLTPTLPSPEKGGEKEYKMNTNTETKPEVTTSETTLKAENPMQERHCDAVTESVGMTAEAAFTARRLESQGETGPVFVP